MSNRDIAKRYLEGSGRSEQPKLQDMYKQVVINEVLGNVRDPYGTPTQQAPQPNTQTDDSTVITHNGKQWLVFQDPRTGEKKYIEKDRADAFMASDRDNLQSKYMTISDYLNHKSYNKQTLGSGHFGGIMETIVDTPGGVDEMYKWVTTNGKVDTTKQPKILQNKSGKISDIVSGFQDKEGNSYQLGAELLSRMVGRKWTDRGGSNIGPGEIALSIVFSDVSNQTSGGGDLSLSIGGKKGKVRGDGESDLNVDGDTSKIEVKGLTARFGQQPGRDAGGGESWTLEWKSGLDSWLKPVVNMDLNDDGELLKDFVMTTWNASNPNIIELFDYSWRLLDVADDDKLKSLCVDSLKSGLLLAYPSAEKYIKSLDLNSVLDKHINAPSKYFEKLNKSNDPQDKLALKKLLTYKKYPVPGLTNKKQFPSGSTGWMETAAPLKNEFLRMCAINYLQSDKHGYEYVLFIDKNTTDYALITTDNIIRQGGYISQNKFITDVNHAQKGFSFTTMYPNLSFNF
jgi:hypothetical protein